MADTENETYSGDLPVLQPLPPTHFVKEKACSSQKQQEQPDLQTCSNNSFQLFADTLISKFENLTSKIVEKSPSRTKANRKKLRKGRQSDKLDPLTKDVPTPSEFLLANNLNGRIGTIEASQKMLQTYSNSPYYKISENLQRFLKSPGNQNKGNKSSNRTKSYNNHQKQRQGYQRLQYHKRN